MQTHATLEKRKHYTIKLSSSTDSEHDEESSEESDNIKLITGSSSESDSGIEDTKGNLLTSSITHLFLEIRQIKSENYQRFLHEPQILQVMDTLHPSTSSNIHGTNTQSFYSEIDFSKENIWNKGKPPVLNVQDESHK